MLTGKKNAELEIGSCRSFEVIIFLIGSASCGLEDEFLSW